MATTTNTTRRTTKRRGFTLAELSIVMVIGGTLMAVGVPKAVALRRQMELDTASRRFAMELRAAKHQAVRTNSAVTVTLVGSNAYTVGTRRVTLPDGITFHSSSPTSMTFVPFGPMTGTGSGRFSLKYTNETRTDVAVSNGGMVSVARHNNTTTTTTTTTVTSPTVITSPTIQPVTGIVQPVTSIVTQ